MDCAFGGRYQKWTTLLAAGPRAARLRPLRGLECVHPHHEERAHGRAEDGSMRAAEAAEYPVLFSATVAGLLSAPGEIGAGAREVLEALQSKEASSLHRLGDEVGPSVGEERRQVGAPTSRENGRQQAPGAQESSRGWRASVEAMPAGWDERNDVFGERATQERSRELRRYVSRAEPEGQDELALRELPRRRQHPDLKAKARRERVQWPEGAPARPIAIRQLYNGGVYERVLAKVREEARSVREAIAEGEGFVAAKVACGVFKAAVSQPAWAAECVWNTSDPADCVPLQPFSEDDPPIQQARAEFFIEWAEKLQWKDEDMIQQVATTGADSGSVCSRDMLIFGHHTGLREHVSPAQAVVEADTNAGW
ncbi:MAG: hypothetical protein SGPRY_008297 [Prymnesium sp.]